MAVHLRRNFSTRTSYLYNVFRSTGEKPNLNINSEADSAEDTEFRTLDIMKKKQSIGRQLRPRTKKFVPPPRSTQMPVDQDWVSVWPWAHSFKASVVPLPIRQGYSQKSAPPSKYGNAELMKIPNFLHLTPPAIKRHCDALQKFCTPWPKALHDDETCAKHFPLKIITNDYCHSGPSIRDPRSRIVTLKIKLSALNLDSHAKDKIIRLVGDRYNVLKDTITIVTDRCPMRKQNYDYSIYLLTALYHESQKVEVWESEKQEDDMELYIWDGSKSQTAITKLVQEMKKADNIGERLPSTLKAVPHNCNPKDIHNIDIIKNYAVAVTDVHNKGEDCETVKLYKESVLQVLNLTPELHQQ